MAKRSYTETIEAFTEALEDIRAKMSEPSGDGVFAQRLDAIEANQREMMQLLKQMNGSVRTNCTDIAVLNQWRADHGETHEGLDKRVSNINAKTNTVGVANTLVAGLSGLLAALLGK